MKKLLNIITLFLTMCGTINLSSQKSLHRDNICLINLSQIVLCADNDYDSLGQKDGYWLEKFGDNHIALIFYKNGKKNGLARYYSPNLEDKNKLYLRCIGQYQDDNENGQWYWFLQNGNINSVMDRFSANTLFLKEVDVLMKKKQGYYPKDSTRQAYCRFYDRNGRIREEGWIIYVSGSIESDCDYVGTWKYYNDDGSITKRIWGSD